MKKLISLLLTLALCLTAFAVLAEALPAPQANPEDMFGVDMNINMTTIDNYVGRDDVVYRDVRMLFDPADYGAIGGNADLSSTIEGFINCSWMGQQPGQSSRRAFLASSVSSFLPSASIST